MSPAFPLPSNSVVNAPIHRGEQHQQHNGLHQHEQNIDFLLVVIRKEEPLILIADDCQEKEQCRQRSVTGRLRSFL